MNIKERLIALYNLSQQGIGGERENAESDDAGKNENYDPKLIIKQMANMEDVQVYPQLEGK